jgi:hypothetical protein
MASGADGAAIKKRINQAIHPPVDDAAKILAAADRVYIELPFFPPRGGGGRARRVHSAAEVDDLYPSTQVALVLTGIY